jgi:hypothetical protein
MVSTHPGIYTAPPSWANDPAVVSVVKARMTALGVVRPGEISQRAEWSAGLVFGGGRCTPGSVAYRGRRSGAGRGLADLDLFEVASGQHDQEIVDTWIERASAEHYYAYEKDWG